MIKSHLKHNIQKFRNIISIVQYSCSRRKYLHSWDKWQNSSNLSCLCTFRNFLKFSKIPMDLCSFATNATFGRLAQCFRRRDILKLTWQKCNIAQEDYLLISTFDNIWLHLIQDRTSAASVTGASGEIVTREVSRGLERFR